MYRVVPSLVRLCFLVGWLALAPGATAQETRDLELPDLDREFGLIDFVEARLTVANRFVGNADYGSFEGTSNQPETRLRVTVPLSKRFVVRLSGTFRALLYDWDGTSSLPGAQRDGDPFGDLFSWAGRVQTAYLFSEDMTLFSDRERWALIAQGGVKANWENGGSMGTGLLGGGGLAVGYRFGDRFEGVLGLSLGEQLMGGGLSIGPMFEFDLKITEKWSVQSYGTGLQIERIITPDLKLFTRVRLENSTYRLDDRGGAIGTGAVKVRQLPVGLGIQWDVGIFRVRAAAGAMFLQRIRLRNSNDDTIGTETADPSPYLTVRVDLRS